MVGARTAGKDEEVKKKTGVQQRKPHLGSVWHPGDSWYPETAQSCPCHVAPASTYLVLACVVIIQNW